MPLPIRKSGISITREIASSVTRRHTTMKASVPSSASSYPFRAPMQGRASPSAAGFTRSGPRIFEMP
jgi:hypothetical protein